PTGASGMVADVVPAPVTASPVADTPILTIATTAQDPQSTLFPYTTLFRSDGAEVGFFRITNVTNGTLFLHDGVTPVSDGAFLTLAQANAGLKFTPNANFNGTASFQIQASLSNSAAGLGGNAVTATITVSPV